jgi:outer membrane lipoprotein-sorting protein
MELLLALALAAAPPPDNLASLAAALRSAAAWRAAFTQVYVPEGFSEGTSEGGTLTIAPPARLRFDYTSGSPRTFTADGHVGRLVDDAAGSCDAVRLDAGTWGRLPLAAVLDPAAARRSFTVESHGRELRLVPHEPTPDLGEITVLLDRANLPASVTVVDGSGTRNAFTFTGWRRVAAPPAAFFEATLPGKAPCEPAEGDTETRNR